jgi:dGTPase
MKPIEFIKEGAPMNNRFYTPFDTETLEPRAEDYRSPFQRDRDRIIHAAAFRRLQAKTQVFLSGEFDFYRTRLTHSIEVAQIGRSICNYLCQSSELLSDDFFIDADLVEAVCLAHDLGHPPFGHAGEATLNKMMSRFGGFEGNAQTLRIITEIIFSSRDSRQGMNPTRALIDGVMKYKTLYSQLHKPKNHFLYDYQQRYLAHVFAGQAIPDSLPPGPDLDHFRSIECLIMDWADDTAYSVNDLIDGINANLITLRALERWAQDNPLDQDQQLVLDKIFNTIRTGNIEKTLGREIGEFILACRLVERENFMSDLTNRYRFDLAIDADVKKRMSLYKRIAIDLVFISPPLSQIRYKEDRMLRRIFRTLFKHYRKTRNGRIILLPGDVARMIQQPELTDKQQVRILCDYLAGMTDRFALRTYRRLFDPNLGGMSELM